MSQPRCSVEVTGLDTARISPELDAVRLRRAELKESVGTLEEALAAPSPGREPEWGELVRCVLLEVSDDFAAHVTVTEGPDGLHQAILAGDLRLANAVGALATEHVEIASALAELITLCNPPVTTTEAAVIREMGTKLLGRIVRHRQRGADLIYEAYQTDVGGSD